MKMELLENGCLKILLTEEDLNRLGLSFASLDYDTPATRSAMQTLLLAARNETGFDPTGGLVVEALPVDDGCLLLFTPTGSHRRIRLKKAVGPYIYEVEDAEQLFRLAEGLSRYRQPLQKRQLLISVWGKVSPGLVPGIGAAPGGTGPDAGIFPQCRRRRRRSGLYRRTRPGHRRRGCAYPALPCCG